MKANLHHRGHRRTPRKTRRRRRSVAHTARSRHFDAVVRKQIYFATSSVFSAPFFTSFFTALAPFFTSVPVSVAAVFVASRFCRRFLRWLRQSSPLPSWSRAPSSWRRLRWSVRSLRGSSENRELRTHPYPSGVSFS